MNVQPQGEGGTINFSVCSITLRMKRDHLQPYQYGFVLIFPERDVVLTHG